MDVELEVQDLEENRPENLITNRCHMDIQQSDLLEVQRIVKEIAAWAHVSIQEMSFSTEIHSSQGTLYFSALVESDAACEIFKEEVNRRLYKQ